MHAPNLGTMQMSTNGNQLVRKWSGYIMRANFHTWHIAAKLLVLGRTPPPELFVVILIRSWVPKISQAHTQQVGKGPEWGQPCTPNLRHACLPQGIAQIPS